MTIHHPLSRLELHNSHIQQFMRTDTTLFFTVDWAKLEHVQELDISKPIVMGTTALRFSGISYESLLRDGDAAQPIPVPVSMLPYWQEIGLVACDDAQQTMLIAGFFSLADAYFWVEWRFRFETCEVTWQSHITLDEWKQGKLVG